MPSIAIHRTNVTCPATTSPIIRNWPTTRKSNAVILQESQQKCVVSPNGQSWPSFFHSPRRILSCLASPVPRHSLAETTTWETESRRCPAHNQRWARHLDSWSEHSCRFITRDSICEKTQIILWDVKALFPDSQQAKLSFWYGWIWNFQRRWNLKSRRLYGKASGGGDDVIAGDFLGLWNICKMYALTDIYNANETAGNYCTPSDCATY